MASFDKRSSDRYHTDSPVMFSHFADHPYCYYGAKMRDSSKGGISIESKYNLKPGELISVCKTHPFSQDTCHSLNDPIQLRVVWCKQASDLERHPYKIGAALLDPASIKNGFISTKFSKEPKIHWDMTFARPDAFNEPIVEEESKLDLRAALEINKSSDRELQILNHFAMSIASTLHLDEILQIICKEMVHIFGANNTGIGLLNKEKSKLKIVAFYVGSNQESDATGLELPIEGNASTWYVITTGQPIVTPDTQNNPITESVHDIAVDRGTQCLMIIPLIAQGEIIGTIGVKTSDKERIFTPEEVSLAQTIASQVTGAITNARLFSEEEQARRSLEQDMEIGQKIQTDFFPNELPMLSGWEIAAHYKAANRVTGDFYDFISIEGNRKIVLVIADICDHGVGSGLFMVLFRSLIRAYTLQTFLMEATVGNHQHDRLAEVLTNIIKLTNNYIENTHDESCMFATVFLGILIPDMGLLKYINCGHMAPLIVDGKGIKASLKPTGPAVGLLPGLEYSVKETHLSHGDTLIAFTDGAIEAENHKGEPFSLDRFLQLVAQPSLSASNLLYKVTTEIHNHVSGMEQHDDITLFAIRRQ